MTVTTMSRGHYPPHRATAQEREAMDRRLAETRARLAAGWLDELHATPMPVRVQLIRTDLGPELTVEREVEATVAHHSCHTAADCWPAHAPGVVARHFAAEWAAAHGVMLQYVVHHGLQDLWLAYLARPGRKGTLSTTTPEGTT